MEVLSKECIQDEAVNDEEAPPFSMTCAGDAHQFLKPKRHMKANIRKKCLPEFVSLWKLKHTNRLNIYYEQNYLATPFDVILKTGKVKELSDLQKKYISVLQSYLHFDAVHERNADKVSLPFFYDEFMKPMLKKIQEDLMVRPAESRNEHEDEESKENKSMRMSNNMQAADFLRKAADALTQGGTDTTERTSRTVAPTNMTNTNTTSTTSALRSLFGSYSTSRGGHGSIPRRFSGVSSTSTSYWTHRFFALANSSQEHVPTKEERHVLQKAGLGEKKITFKKNNDANYFLEKICEIFPKLNDIGGFEILRTEPGRRQLLDKLMVPSGGYTVAFLADESALGQAICYLRPIQVDIDVEPDDVEIDSCGPEEKCLNCFCMVGVNQLREHISMCKKETRNELEDIKLEKPKKRSRPICDFTCELKKDQKTQEHIAERMSNNMQAADFLRKAADALTQGGTDTTERTSRTVAPTNMTNTNTTSTTSALRSLFGSYSTSRGGHGSIPRRFSGVSSTSTSYWTHRFFALANSSQEHVPTKEERHVLQKAGLGEKKITFKKNNDANYFLEKICEIFPKLNDIGGFEILRTEPGRRQLLDKLMVPSGGYTVAFLADESALGQAICYLRPIQVDIDVEPDDVEIDSCGPEEKCLNCFCMVGVNQLREHISMCKKETRNELEDIKLEKPKKRSRPICDFTCELKKDQKTQEHIAERMSNNMQAADFLRKAADALTQGGTDTTERTSRTVAPTNMTNTNTTSTTSALRSLFGSYSTSRGGHGSIPRRFSGVSSTSTSYWTHRFFALANSSQEHVPTKEERHVLQKAGLGEKKITFKKNNDANYFLEKICEIFPKLNDIGGFEILRTEPGRRQLLDKLMVPSGGYTVAFLADESALGQAICYLRPIQVDIDVEPDDVEIDSCGPEEKCLNCFCMVGVNQLREHISMCKKETRNELEDIKLEKPKKRSRPICDFTCELKKDQKTQEHIAEEYSCCPICFKMFAVSELGDHAALCDIKIDKSPETPKKITTEQKQERSLEEALTALDEKMSSNKKETWDIAVIRRFFQRTAMEQLENGTEEEWVKDIKVKFIGEEGVDSGGLSREFFTLLFEKTEVFENGCFSLISDSIEKKHYFYIGRAVARAILLGHPGPACLNQYVVDFILQEKEPTTSQLSVEQLSHREDVVSAIKQIDEATTETSLRDVFMELADLFQMVGFTRNLTEQNKEQAKCAIMKHFLFYRGLPAALQFIEGLKLVGILNALRKFPLEGSIFLVQKESETRASDVLEFFQPVYSDKQSEKEIEEVLVYNFHQLVKKIEQRKLETSWVELLWEGNGQDTDKEKKVIIEMSHLIQALTGSKRLPRNINSGLILFDHKSNNLVTVNTCAPSISMAKCTENQEYVKFEESFLNVIIGAPDFGIE